jgi:serine/threonine protein kinase
VAVIAPGPAAWTPPAAFDGFELRRLLGAGGMGVVYLAREVLLDRPVALKLIPDPDRSAHAIARFAIEVRALARVQHPNVVGVYRAGEVEGRPYLAQELLVGERLDELARPAPWRRVLAIGRGLARAIAAAHARNVLHRDIKPGNVMLVGGHRVKLFDFGLARLLDDSGTNLAPGPTLAAGSSGRLTAAGGVAGTPAYLAPELWDGGDATVRSDVYALGLVLYELLAGELPHAALHGFELAQAVQHHDLPRLGAVRGDVPARLCALVDRCVARDPARRPASSAVVRDELDAIGGTCHGRRGAWELDAPPRDGAWARGAYDDRATHDTPALDDPASTELLHLAPAR